MRDEEKTPSEPAALDRSNEVLAKLVGARAGSIEAMFRRIPIAEREIAAAKRRWPRKRKALHAAFQYLCAPPALRDKADALYVSHVRELLGRVVRSEDLRPGTDAELLVALSDASLRTPLASEYAHAMSTVFRSVFPDAPPELEAGLEGWAGRTAEILADARRRLARDRA